MAFLFVLFIFLAPLIGFIAGFLAGALRPIPLGIMAAIIVIVSPSAYLLAPLLVPGGSPEERYGPAFALTMFGVHSLLWALFATLGAFVGAARGRRAG
ncbi:MAG TPA: hypothetical protein VEA61_03220 [Allosphingosinicella sp.]|nr:hypothetical protein [Allosphingosinicella sp.]